MSPDQADAVVDNIVYTADYGQIAGCDLVIEAATESIPLKQKIFAASKISSPGHDHHLQYQLHPRRSHFFRHEAPGAKYGHPFFRTGMAKPSRGDRRLGGGQPADGGRSVLVFCANRQGARHYRQCHMLHAGPHLRQLVQRSRLPAGQRHCRPDRHGGRTVRVRRSVFCPEHGQRNPIIIETNTLQMEEGAHYRPAPILGSVDGG